MKKKIIALYMLMSLVIPIFLGPINAYGISADAREEGVEQTSEIESQPLLNDQEPLVSTDIMNPVEEKISNVVDPVKENHLTLSWLSADGTKTNHLDEAITQEYWKGQLQITGNLSLNEQSELNYIIDMGNKFQGTLSSQNPDVHIRNLAQKGQWEVSGYPSVDKQADYQEEIDVVIEKQALKEMLTQNNVFSLDAIQLVYEKNQTEVPTLTLSLTLPLDEPIVEETPKTERPLQESPLTINEEAENKTSKQIVANLSVSEVYSNTSPLAGEYFDMTVRVNSGSIGEFEESIKNTQITVTFPDSIDIISLPTSNNYRVKTEKVGLETKVTIDYLNELPVGKMLALPFGLRFKQGISLPTTTLNGSLKVTASNANGKDKLLNGIHPRINVPTNHLVAEKDPDAEPIEVHTSKITIIPEAEIGGVNIKNGKLHIEFPADIELYSVVYQGVNYPVSGPVNGVYAVDILVGDILVSNTSTTVELTYEYPYSSTGASKTHEIKATLTGERLDGTLVNDDGVLSETVPALGNVSGYPGIKFFTKTAPEKLLKNKDQTLAYTLTFTPRLDMRDVYLVDDPIRQTNEPDFFEGFRYQSFSWSAQKSKNPAIKGLVSTEIVYQTKKNRNWQSMGVTRVANTISVASLGLANDDYITTVKYIFTYQGSTKLPKDAGKVSISAIGKTADGVKNSTLSLADGLTNTLHIYGDRKHANAPDSSYEAFVEGGYEANQDDANNTQTATTIFTGEGAYAGYSNWEQPFSPRINDIDSTFIYQINVNNVSGSGPLKDAILYITVPTSINIEKVELVNPQHDPNAQIEIRRVNDNLQLVVIRYNNDWRNNEGHNDNHAIKITANGSEKVKKVEEFNNYLVSGDKKQNYDGGAAWVPNVPGVGGVVATMSKERKVEFNRSVGLDSQKEISKDGVNFSRVINLSNQQQGTDVTYRLTVPNNGSIKINELHIIDSLPSTNDTMTISNSDRHSTIGGQLKAIALADGTALGSNYELYYSMDASAENNLIELTNLTNGQSTWHIWDGQTPLDKTTTAIKIIKKDGLDKQQAVSFHLSYHIPKIEGELETVWNSFAVGGSYIDGATNATLEVGEPIKSGAYVGQEEPTKKIAGIIWSDENANGLREQSEARIPDTEVNLYDWNNDLVSTTKTAADGSYAFNHLYNKKYRVTIKRVRSTFSLTTYQTGSDKKVDNDFLELDEDNQYGQAVVDLQTENEPLNIDGGYTEPTTIDGYIWYDSDRDGVQTAGERPASNISVSLYRLDNTRQETFVQTVQTGANGKYYFTGAQIKPGNYLIHAKIPENHAATIKGSNTETQNSKFNSNGKTDEITVKKGTNSDWDLGLVIDLPTYTQVEGKKIWKGDQNKKKQRPESILVQVLQDGIEYGDPILVKSNQTDEWHFSLDGLPEYQPQSDQKYVYTVKEVNVPKNYTSEVDNATFTITNTYLDNDVPTEESTSSEPEESTSETQGSTASSDKKGQSSNTTESYASTKGSDTIDPSKRSNNNNRTNQTTLPKTGEKVERYILMGIMMMTGTIGFSLLKRNQYRKL
ncbi:SdrD B-like domain-containing protein [Candidatus Enterococcus mansonii]|uniref:Gram-positive cocci surface proteins LPxTG domain-containing protein n=1 Tax=Candidatus Enterococcus mansonii TaxID=1834181 RepID=A0A242CE92_9ENTE|nr:SdrD B-like domain-containing protein [Enterococcus sp. 4G2_DIV0659]OTO08438.1 hypothetical protein A5880_001438 [Enterococcus sp. 4G2_DIV0659]